MRNFGTAPLFVFDPDNPANRPLPSDRVNLWWSLYPQSFRRVFTRAFTVGLHDASLYGRVKEGTWRRALLSLHDSVSSCPNCGYATFYDSERPDRPCWNCHRTLPVPPRLELPGGTLVLSEGATVTSHHLNRDRGYSKTCAVVEPHPGRPGRVVLRNLTGQDLDGRPGRRASEARCAERAARRPADADRLRRRYRADRVTGPEWPASALAMN